MINPHLTCSLRIKAFDDRYGNTLSLAADELLLYQFNNSSNILSSFFCYKLNYEFDMFLFSLVLEGDLLIEDKFVVIGGLHLISDSLPLVF